MESGNPAKTRLSESKYSTLILIFLGIIYYWVFGFTTRFESFLTTGTGKISTISVIVSLVVSLVIIILYILSIVRYKGSRADWGFTTGKTYFISLILLVVALLAFGPEFKVLSARDYLLLFTISLHLVLLNSICYALLMKRLKTILGTETSMVIIAILISGALFTIVIMPEITITVKRVLGGFIGAAFYHYFGTIFPIVFMHTEGILVEYEPFVWNIGILIIIQYGALGILGRQLKNK